MYSYFSKSSFWTILQAFFLEFQIQIQIQIQDHKEASTTQGLSSLLKGDDILPYKGFRTSKRKRY